VRIVTAAWCVPTAVATNIWCLRTSLGPASKHSAQAQMSSWYKAEVASKRPSRPMFQFLLSAVVEFCTSLLGAFIAFPHAFLGPTPLAIAKLVALSTDIAAHGLLDVMIALFWAAGLLLFYGGLAGFFEFKKALKIVIFAFPTVTFLVLASCGLPSQVEVACLRSLTCALLTIVLLVPTNAACNCVQPAVVLGLVDRVCLKKSALVVPYIRTLCAGGQTREAMPSADAGIMAANAMVLCQALTLASITWIPKVLGGGLLITCCCGCRYFWAHDLWDVLVGAGVGACVASCTMPLGIGTRRWHAFIAYIAFLGALVAMQRRTKSFNDETQRSKTA